MAEPIVPNSGDDMGKVECTRSFMEELAENFGIPYLDIEYAFEGESRNTALRVCQSVEEKEIVSPRKRGEAVCDWARKYRKGHYRYASRPGPTGGPTVAPTQRERIKYPVDQIARNLWRMSDGGLS